MPEYEYINKNKVKVKFNCEIKEESESFEDINDLIVEFLGSQIEIKYINSNEIEISNIQEEQILERLYPHLNLLEHRLCSPLYTDEDSMTARFICHDDSEVLWSQFVGRCLLSGIQLGYSVPKILHYIFKTYENFSIDELPSNIELVMDDMFDYLETMTSPEV